MTDSTEDGAAEGPLPRRYLALAVVGFSLLIAAIDQTILATALVSIEEDLDATVNWTTWTITVYGLVQVIVLPFAGRFSDQYGRKVVFISALVLFTAASLAAGFATTIQALVVFRAVQALGGGAFMPSATGIVSDFFGRDRDRAIGLFASIFPIGGIVGPILGGLFVTYWSWRGIFLVNIPIGVVTIVAGLALLPNSRGRPKGRLDVVGSMLLLVGLLSGMLATSILSDRPALAVIVPLYAVAVIALLTFLRHSARTPDAVVPLRLIKGRSFGPILGINFVAGAATLGFGALVPIFAQNEYGLSGLEAGTLLTARAVGMIAVSATTTYLMRRVGYRWPMGIGFALMAIGFGLTALAPPWDTQPYAWLATSSAITGIGMGVSIPASNVAAIQLAPESAAAISGLRGMTRQTGGIVSISVVSAVAAASSAPGHVQAVGFLVFVPLLLALVPLQRFVPDNRGS